jgi:PAS domain S-box-containing protein
MIQASGHRSADDALVAAHSQPPGLVYRSGARGAVLTREALAEAVDQAEEGILITDLQGTITYANPAFARSSGYSLAELVGQNPRLLKSGVHTQAFYERMWARLTAGRSFSGVFVNRRKDDVLTREATIISPYRDGDGAIAGFVGIKRTLDRSHAARDLARERADRAAVVGALESLQPLEDVTQTAVRVCERIVEVPNLHLAAVIAFDEEGAIPLVVRFADGHRRTVARKLPALEATGLREATFGGPWVYPLDPDDGRTLTGPARDAGVTLLGAAPLRTNGHLPGVLVVGCSGDGVGVAERLLPTLSEFGAVASALLAPGLDRRATEMAERRLLQRVLRNSAFESVFQPVVDTDDGSVAGYELLTRFTDGVAPQERFAMAQAVGLGPRLEAAAIRRGLAAARRLPPGGWLSVNVGPELLTATRELAGLLAAADRPVILEITEHEVIEEYAAIRAAVDKLGPGVSLAVDDAGAGYASLRHILELRPDYVKIDAAIVRGVADDPVRHAMVAGFRFFADGAGCQLIAEGVETEADRDKLRELGIGMGQGYLFGRPRLPADIASAADP